MIAQRLGRIKYSDIPYLRPLVLQPPSIAYPEIALASALLAPCVGASGWVRCLPYDQLDQFAVLIKAVHSVNPKMSTEDDRSKPLIHRKLKDLYARAP